jgi:glycosyltransferase involved in cell wall biosynthesis
LAVLQLIPRLDSGGAERTTVEITEALVAAGARALVATEGGRLTGAVEAAGGRIIQLPLTAKNPVTILATGFALARLVRREGIAILHARSRGPAWSALIAARLSGAKLVTTYHGLYAAKGALKRRYNSVMARGARVIANSEFTARHVAAAYPAARPRLRTIPRGVDLAVFDPARVSDEAVAALRRSWAVPEEAPIILLPGRLARKKGPDLVVDAIARLRDQGKALHVVALLVGEMQSEALRAELAARIDQLGLTSVVRMVGHHGDMVAVYRAAAVVVQPSRTPEAFGRVAAEAQAMGVPVIASNLGAAPETVRTGLDATGFLVEPDNAAALAAALERALALSEDERHAMAARARAHIAARYTLTRMCTDTLAVYAEVIGDAG